MCYNDFLLIWKIKQVLTPFNIYILLPKKIGVKKVNLYLQTNMKSILFLICFLAPWIYGLSQATNSEDNTALGVNLGNGYTFPSCGLPVKRGPFSIGEIKSIYVPMWDTVQIALDVVLPTMEESSDKIPAVLIMTRYWRGLEGGGYTQEQNFFASHGYAVVTGDVRGTGASFGVWPYQRSRQETLDFGEIMEWVTKQPWSNGEVIGWGSSYTANTADWMMERNHPALKAVVSRFPDYDPYMDLYFPGGVPNAYMGKKWGKRVKDLDLNVKQKSSDGIAQGVRPVDKDTSQTILNLAIESRRSVSSVWEGLKNVKYRDDRPESWHGASFNDWGIYSKNLLVEQSKVPIQSWGSWMDAGTANGVINRFMSLSNPQRAFIGAWAHGGSPNASPYTLNSKSEDPAFPVQIVEGLCFLNEHTEKGDYISKEHGPQKLLTYFTIGEEQWKTATEWPLPQTKWESWYLGAGNQLSKDRSKQDNKAKDAYVVNFNLGTGEKNRWTTNNGGGGGGE